MKLHIEIDENIIEDEIVIRCREMTDDVLKMQKMFQEYLKAPMQLKVTRQSTEYYIPVEEVLFLETSDAEVAVHTKDEIYFSKSRLYELEEQLPGGFIRASKSAIINTDKVRGIQKNITGSSAVEFTDTGKKAYVSRNYIKTVMDKIEERRFKR